MRQPRNHAEVAHQWASREVESGSCGNMNFRNDTIYSYGWWDMARNCTGKNETPYVIMTSCRYSNSTAKHLNYVGRAIPMHIQVFSSDETSGGYGWMRGNYPILSPEAVVRTFVRRLEANYNEFFKLKNHEKLSTERWVKHNKDIYSKAQEFCELSGAKWDQNLDKFLLSQHEINLVERMLIPYMQEMEIKRAKADRMKEIIEAAQERVYAKFGNDDMEMAKLWIREGGERARRSWWGEKINLPQDDPDVKASKLKFITRSMETAMRIEGDQIVTNRSARVPLESGKRLWELMKRRESVIGEKVGLYTVVKNNGELVIGCHHIKREIVDYFVEYYGW